jgi:hypothetical protein
VHSNHPIDDEANSTEQYPLKGNDNGSKIQRQSNYRLRRRGFDHTPTMTDEWPIVPTKLHALQDRKGLFIEAVSLRAIDPKIT